jgi:hypothetical protein
LSFVDSSVFERQSEKNGDRVGGQTEFSTQLSVAIQQVIAPEVTIQASRTDRDFAETGGIHSATVVLWDRDAETGDRTSRR